MTADECAWPKYRCWPDDGTPEDAGVDRDATDIESAVEMFAALRDEAAIATGWQVRPMKYRGVLARDLATGRAFRVRVDCGWDDALGWVYETEVTEEVTRG